MTEFDDVEGFAGWSAKLLELLEEAEEITLLATPQDRIELSRRLRAFMVKSGPNTDEITALDEIAAAAASDVLKAGIEDRLAALSSRHAELITLRKKLDSVATDLTKTASSIRLDRAAASAVRLRETVQSLKELQETLSGDHDDLGATIGKLVERIQHTRALIEGLYRKRPPIPEG